MKHKKLYETPKSFVAMIFRRKIILMLIAILFVLAILTTNAFAGVWDSIKKQSGNWGSLALLSGIVIALGWIIGYYGDDLILMNPIVSGPNANPAIANTVNSFLYLLIPFYIIALVITGIYFLFSQSPGGRAKSKSMFFKLIISMGAVLISLPLFQLLLDISQGIAQFIFSMGSGVSMERIIGGTITLSTIIASLFIPLPSGKLIAFIIFLFLILTLIVIGLIFVVRYLLVVLSAIIFPFTLFLWLFDFPYIKHFGAKLMHHTIVWIFVPVVTAFVVVIASIIAGGFYEQCSGLGLGIGTGLVGAGAAVGGIGGAVLGIVGGSAILSDQDCWLSFFAGLASTFLILGTPLMMYGIMDWLGVTILLFGWTTAGAPRTPAAGLGPGSVFYTFPGADALFRIPGFERFAGWAFGGVPLYGTGGGIIGGTHLTEGYSLGEFPIGAPPIIRGFRQVPKIVDQGLRAVEESRFREPLGTLAQRLRRTETLPSGEILKRGIPLVDRGLEIGKGLREGLADRVALAEERGVIPPEKIVRGVSQGKDYTYRLMEAHEKGYEVWHPRVFIPKLGPVAVVAAGGVLAGMGPAGIIVGGLKGLWYEPGASFPMEGEIPLAGGGSRRFIAPEWYVKNYNPEIVLLKAPNAFIINYRGEIPELLKADPKLETPAGKKLKEIATKFDVKPEELPGFLERELKTSDGRGRLANKMNIDTEELPPPGVAPPQTPEVEAEKKRRDVDEELMREMEGLDKKKEQEIGKVRGSSKSDKLKRLDEDIIDNKYNIRAREVREKSVKRLKDIDRELREKRTYGKHPVERGIKEIDLDKVKWKGMPSAPLEQVESILGDMWPAFGHTARILARQANLMHGLKNLKTYSPTPPMIPDWSKRKWEEEEKRRGQ